MEQNLRFNHPVFLDSGAHGLYNEQIRGQITKYGRLQEDTYKWFTTKEFYDYVDTYAEFIKQHQSIISRYVNVDVIFNPQLTWDVQMYLERTHGLHPMPIVHYGTDGKWLKRYIAKGYDYIGIGGLGQGITKEAYMKWADEMYKILCPPPYSLPVVRTHGFAITAHTLMVRYPWYSVDSTSWLKYGSYGQVIFPVKENGEWCYTKSFHIVRLSMRSSSGFNKISMVHESDKLIRKQFLEYIEEKGYKLGESRMEGKEEVMLIPGLCNDDKLRCEINALYYIDLAESMPTWPWAFRVDKLQPKIEL
jgi:hypothetical protein